MRMDGWCGVSGGGRVAAVLWLVSGPRMVPPRPAGVVTESGVGDQSPLALHPARVLGLRVLGRSLSLGPCPAPSLPVGHPARPIPLLGTFLFSHTVSVRMDTGAWEQPGA